MSHQNALPRRRLLAFAAPAALSAAAMPALAAAAASDDRAFLAQLETWRRYEAALNEASGAADADFSLLFELENRIYFQPCTSLGAAIAKLTMLGLSFDRGDRTDGTEEEVLAEILAYLRTRV